MSPLWLIPRRSDDPVTFRARLERYRHRITAIRRHAGAAGLPYCRVDASGTTADCVAAVHTAINALGVLPVGPAHVTQLA